MSSERGKKIYQTGQSSSSELEPRANKEVWDKVDQTVKHDAGNFTDRIIETATKGKDVDARRRIEKAGREIVLPGLAEAMTIAHQVANPEYRGNGEGQGFIPGMAAFLNYTDQRGRICADLRGSLPAYGAYPLLYLMTRSAGADPNTVPARTQSGFRLGDIDYRAGIKTSVRDRNAQGQLTPEFVYYTGPHFDSINPTTNSCAANAATIQGAGGLARIDMVHGGIAEWFGNVGSRFFAHDDEVREQGGISTTFDISLDTHDQSLIAGLRENHKYIDPRRDLASNLQMLARHGLILTSNQILDMFGEDIMQIANELGVQGGLDIFDYTRYSFNMQTIGTIARHITEREERINNFDWIPPHLVIDQSSSQRVDPDAARAFAFSMISNATYRKITGVGSGDTNPLKHHPETMLRVGPTGADYNVQTVALIQGTPGGELQQQDIARVQTLSTVLTDNLDHLGFGAEETARVIRVTGMVDLEVTDEKARTADLDRALATVERNLEILAPQFENGIKNGSVLMFGTIHDRVTRNPVEIVTI